jgi:hypothetical protein
MDNPEKDQFHYMMFLRIFSRWIRFHNTKAETVEESAARQESFPETEGSTQTATILLHVADICTNGSVINFSIKYYLSQNINHYQLVNRSHLDSDMSIAMIR